MTSLALALLTAGSAAALPQGAEGLLERDALLGDLGGLRPTLAASGIEVEVGLILDGTTVVSGGAERNEATRGLFDVAASFDMATLAGIEGGLVFLDAYSIFGEQDSGAGNIQGVSNIDADVRDQIAELWWEQLFFDERLRVKVGKVEANSEFAFVDYGGELIGPAWAISPNVLGIPTYPETAVSVNAQWTPNDETWFSLGIYDGAAQSGYRTGLHGVGTAFGSPSDLWIALEGGRAWSDGRLGLGVWNGTGDFAEFGGGVSSGSQGFYAVLDQALSSAVGADGESVTGAGLFARLAVADPDVSEVHVHFATGIQWTGLVESRPDDVCGCGISIAELSKEAGFDEDREVVLETFWRYQVTPWVALKPDLQYIASPGGDSSLDDAVVLGLRVEASL
ncbi:MAG: carbohydrate porin [Planctomycetota bacterium]